MNAVAVEVLANPLQGVAGARFLGIGGVLHARESCHTRRPYPSSFFSEIRLHVTRCFAATYMWWRYGDSNPRPSHCEGKKRDLDGFRQTATNCDFSRRSSLFSGGYEVSSRDGLRHPETGRETGEVHMAGTHPRTPGPLGGLRWCDQEK
jgi:hypothetical protein